MIRHSVIALAISIATYLPASFANESTTPKVVHAIAMHGTAKYGPDFSHFDYVNPNAPKGGSLRMAQQGTFDSFHAFIPKGNVAAGTSTETLLTSSADEPFTQYGLIAKSIEMPADRSWVIFTLRSQARWHDGEPITAKDVAFTFKIYMEDGSAGIRTALMELDRVEIVGEREVLFTAKADLESNPTLPFTLGAFPILPQHYWLNRDVGKTTIEPPLGSGPYRLGEFELGRFIIYDRVDNYWGRDLPVNRGRYNFNIVFNFHIAP